MAYSRPGGLAAAPGGASGASASNYQLVAKDSSDRAYSFFEQLFNASQNFHQITDWGLFLGDAKGAQDYGELQRNQITSVVVCHPNIPFFFEKQGTIDYFRCPVLDTPMFELKKHYEPAIAFIREAFKRRKKCLVHCQKGISRSSALVIAYLMKYDPEGRTVKALEGGIVGGAANLSTTTAGGSVDNLGASSYRGNSEQEEEQDGTVAGAADNDKENAAAPKKTRNEKTFERIFSEVEKRRPAAFPNIGFQEQLRMYFGDQQQDREAPKEYLRDRDRRRDRERDRSTRGGGGQKNSTSCASEALEVEFQPTQIVANVKSRIQTEYDGCGSMVDKLLDSMSFQQLSETTAWKRLGLFFENLYKYEFVDEFVDLRKVYKEVQVEPGEKKGSGSEDDGRDLPDGGRGRTKAGRKKQEEDGGEKKAIKLLVSVDELQMRHTGGNSGRDDEKSKYFSPLIRRGEETIKRLDALDRVLSPGMEGVKMAKAVAREIGNWIKLLKDEEQRRVLAKRADSQERRRQSRERREEEKRQKKEKKRLKKEKKKEKKRLKKEKKPLLLLSRLKTLKAELAALQAENDEDSDESSSSSSGEDADVAKKKEQEDEKKPSRVLANGGGETSKTRGRSRSRSGSRVVGADQHRAGGGREPRRDREQVYEDRRSRGENRSDKKKRSESRDREAQKQPQRQTEPRARERDGDEGGDHRRKEEKDSVSKSTNDRPKYTRAEDREAMRQTPDVNYCSRSRSRGPQLPLREKENKGRRSASEDSRRGGRKRHKR